MRERLQWIELIDQSVFCERRSAVELDLVPVVGPHPSGDPQPEQIGSPQGVMSPVVERAASKLACASLPHVEHHEWDLTARQVGLLVVELVDQQP
jgi:hypothetical protein